MDAVLLSQIGDLKTFDKKLGAFQSSIVKKYNENEGIERRKDAEYDLWRSILSSDISKISSDIQSIEDLLMGLKLEFETIKTNESLELQKVIMSENECKKLRIKYLNLQKLINKNSLQGYIDETTYNITIGISLHYGKELIINGLIFSNILYYCDIQTIMKIETVCKEWKYAINNWKGWKDISINYIWNNIDYLFHNNTNISDEISKNSTASSKGSSKKDLIYLPRFRRFLLTIDTLKNNQFQIEVAGMFFLNNVLCFLFFVIFDYPCTDVFVLLLYLQFK